MILFVALAWAESPDLIPAEGAVVPAPLTVEWADYDGFLDMRLTNPGPALVMVDWNTSVLVTAAGIAVPVVPGSTKCSTAGEPINPSTLPPSASVNQPVIRLDRVNCLLPVGDPNRTGRFVEKGEPGPVTLNLGLMIDGLPGRLVQPFDVQMLPDPPPPPPPPAMTTDQMRSKAKAMKTWAYVVAGGGVAMGAVMAAAIPNAETPEDLQSTVAGAIVLPIGGAISAIPVYLRGKHWEREADAVAPAEPTDPTSVPYYERHE